VNLEALTPEERMQWDTTLYLSSNQARTVKRYLESIAQVRTEAKERKESDAAIIAGLTAKVADERAENARLRDTLEKVLYYVQQNFDPRPMVREALEKTK